MSKKIALILGVFMIGALLVSAWLFGRAPQFNGENISEATSYWKTRAATIGATPAYLEFKNAYARTPPIAHALAHLFGHLIYEQLGDAGISACDSSFGYGCFHQFTTDAALHGGKPEIQSLADFCSKQSAADREACFHGLGHGVSEYFGPSDLADALAECAAFTANEFSCDSGVFMDFNVPLIGGDPTLSPAPRTLDPAHPYEPCDALPKGADAAALRACYGSLAQWWMLAVPQITTRHIGELCEAVPVAYRIACYKGIGINLPGLENYNPSDILAQCESIQSDVGKSACEASSAGVLHGFGKPYDGLCKRTGDPCFGSLSR